jgi:histidyl-tRNA synthetase
MKSLVPNVYVGSLGKKMDVHRMLYSIKLRNEGIKAITTYSPSPKLRPQLDRALTDDQINIMILIGEQEAKDNMVELKILDTKERMMLTQENSLIYLKKYFGIQ